MIDSSLGVVDWIALLVVGGGALTAVSGLRQYRYLRAVTRRAVSTTGTIAEITTQVARGGSGSQSYVPVADYAYRTPTERRDGTTVYPGKSRFNKRFGTEAAAETAIADYEPGDQTTVYYDPNNPAHSFLIADPQTATAISTVVIGVAVLVAGGVFLVV